MYKRYFEKSESVLAIFTNRTDGISSKPFDSLNLAFSTGDDCKNVEENRRRIWTHFDFSENSIAYADQCHSDTISIVDSPKIYTRSDALITKCKNLPLSIQVADCACVYLYDERKQVIGLVHAGWRGSQKKILTKTLQKMEETFSAEAQLIKATISPCISKRYFEVGEDVFKQFHAKYFVAIEGKKWLFDMKRYLFDELRNNGVKDIRIDSQCTYGDKDQYFSYRRDGIKSGRMMGFFYLK